MTNHTATIQQLQQEHQAAEDRLDAARNAKRIADYVPFLGAYIRIRFEWCDGAYFAHVRSISDRGIPRGTVIRQNESGSAIVEVDSDVFFDIDVVTRITADEFHDALTKVFDAAKADHA